MEDKLEEGPSRNRMLSSIPPRVMAVILTALLSLVLAVVLGLLPKPKAKLPAEPQASVPSTAPPAAPAAAAPAEPPMPKFETLHNRYDRSSDFAFVRVYTTELDNRSLWAIADHFKAEHRDAVKLEIAFSRKRITDAQVDDDGLSDKDYDDAKYANYSLSRDRKSEEFSLEHSPGGPRWAGGPVRRPT